MLRKKNFKIHEFARIRRFSTTRFARNLLAATQYSVSDETQRSIYHITMLRRKAARNFVKNDFGERERFGYDSLVVKGLIEVGAIDSYSRNLFLGSYATASSSVLSSAADALRFTIDGGIERATPSIIYVLGRDYRSCATTRILIYCIDYNLRSHRYRGDYLASPREALNFVITISTILRFALCGTHYFLFLLPRFRLHLNHGRLRNHIS